MANFELIFPLNTSLLLFLPCFGIEHTTKVQGD